MRKNGETKEYKSLLVALPYPSGKLHEGNVVGTFLPADVMRRYGALRGKKFRVISGLDAHGTGVFLQMGGVPYGKIATQTREYLKTLEKYGISPDIFQNTCRKDHRKYVRKYLRSHPQIGEQIFECRYCLTCNQECSDRLLWDKTLGQSEEKLKEAGLKTSLDVVCRICNNPPQPVKKKYLVLKYRPQVTKAATKEFQGITSGEESKIISRYLPWGVKSHSGSPGEVYYVWIEALLSYSRLAPTKKVKFFFGKDNLYYHGLVLRQIARGIPYALRTNSYVREHLQSVKGEKISSSSSNSQEVLDSCLVDRLSLILCDPRTQDTTYTKERRLEARKIFYNKFRNTFRRVRGILRKKKLTPVIVYESGYEEAESAYARAMATSNLRKALESVITYCDRIVKELENEVRNSRTSGVTTLPYRLKILSRLIYPLFPYKKLLQS